MISFLLAGYSWTEPAELWEKLTYMILTSLGSNLGADHKGLLVRSHNAICQVDDTYAWLVRKVVNRPWLSKKVVTEEKKERSKKIELEGDSLLARPTLAHLSE